MRIASAIAVTLLATAPAAARQRPTDGDSASAIRTHQAWWRAFTVGDTARLGRLLDDGFHLTLSAGATFGRAGTLRDATVRGDSSRVRLGWFDDDARLIGDAAVVTSRVSEAIGPNASEFRWLSVLRRSSDGWRVVVAQSTRLPAAGKVIPLSAETIAAYAGKYRAPAGGIVAIVARDSGLALVPPNGAEERLRAVTPAVFELVSGKSNDGVVRLVFERDASGRVHGITRLTVSGIVQFIRIP